ncbi:hypothetical protein HY448_00415 [Candidatus Pacearchaeota archaeon]|nr:hypothetical protein [Candidatus Pacearchaeota archaeon]
MLKDLLKELVSTVAGKTSEDIVGLLMDKKHVNEFVIAKKMGLTVNQVRNILYKLSEKGIVSSIRKKDKRKGWYIYFWRIEVIKGLESLKEITKHKIQQISEQIKSRENKIYYVCERCKIEFNEEGALQHDFTCYECGNVFTIKDNSKLIKEMKKNLEKYHKEIAEIGEEIKKQSPKAKKKIVKKIREKKKKVKPKKAKKQKKKTKKGKKK